MSTIGPQLATATNLAGLHPVAISAILATTRAPSAAPGGLAIFAVIVAVIFVAIAVRVTRQLGDLISQFFQMAAAVGGALLMIVIVAILAIALLLLR